MSAVTKSAKDLELRRSLPFLHVDDVTFEAYSHEDNESDVIPEIIPWYVKQTTFEHGRARFFRAASVDTIHIAYAEKEFLEAIRIATRNYEQRNKTAASEAREIHWKNATSAYYVLPQIAAKILSAFVDARYEYFEDGIETEFSRNIIRLVEQYCEGALQALHIMISKNILEPRLVAEAFSWLGQMENSSSRSIRRELLEVNLSHSSPYIRDGAIVGLAYMNDPKSINALKIALQNERIAELQEYIKETIEQLERTSSESE